jgi:predicted metal-dependent hydrolase
MARVTIPRGGSTSEARSFAERNIGWIEKQLQKANSVHPATPEWKAGTQILFRGELVTLNTEESKKGLYISFANERFRIPAGAPVRERVERHLWKLAARELGPLVSHYAGTHGLSVKKVTVRNQRSRWGSCSRRGTISLNWRLVQTPSQVRDYIILHELAHLKQMNHSRRFWAEVEKMCPDYRTAENWLRKNSALLR